MHGLILSWNYIGKYLKNEIVLNSFQTNHRQFETRFQTAGRIKPSKVNQTINPPTP